MKLIPVALRIYEKDIHYPPAAFGFLYKRLSMKGTLKNILFNEGEDYEGKYYEMVANREKANET